MTILKAIIFHCVRCGRVVHSETEETLPICCGQSMAKACTETVNTNASHDEDEGHSAGTDSAHKTP